MIEQKKTDKTIQKDFADIRRTAQQGYRNAVKKHNLSTFRLDNTHLYEYLTALLNAAAKGSYPTASKLIQKTSCPMLFREKATSKTDKRGLMKLRDRILQHHLIQTLDAPYELKKATWDRWASLSLAGFTKELQQRFKMKTERDLAVAECQKEIQLLKEQIRKQAVQVTCPAKDFRGTRREQVHQLKAMGWTISQIADHLGKSTSTIKRDLAKQNG